MRREGCGENYGRSLTDGGATETPAHGARRTHGGACAPATNSEALGHQSTTARPQALSSRHGETPRHDSEDVTAMSR